MLLDDIGDWLQTSGVATKGTNLFKSIDPGVPDTAVTIYEYAGMMPIDTMGGITKTVEQPTVHVLVRGDTYAAAATLARSVFQALHRMKGTINSVRYLHVRALQSPFDVGPDERGRPRLVCNYRIMKELS